VSQTLPSAPVPTGRRRPTPRLPRTRDEVLAATTVVLAALSTLLAFVELYDLGAVLALGAVLLGGTSQLISETRFQRFESVIATVLAAVVLAVCLAYGSGVFTHDLVDWN
jgi:integral membrane sensor domain MASE1